MKPIKPKVLQKTLEQLESLGKGIAKDAVQQLTGNYEENSPDKPQGLPVQQKQQIKADDAQKQNTIRQNITRIDQEIKQIRQKKEQESKRVEEEKKRVPEKVLQQKKKESVLSKLLRSRQGSKEAMQRASG